MYFINPLWKMCICTINKRKKQAIGCESGFIIRETWLYRSWVLWLSENYQEVERECFARTLSLFFSFFFLTRFFWKYMRMIPRALGEIWLLRRVMNIITEEIFLLFLKIKNLMARVSFEFFFLFHSRDVEYFKNEYFDTSPKVLINGGWGGGRGWIYVPQFFAKYDSPRQTR